MYALKIAAEVFIGISAGTITSAGFFAIVMSVGIINRMAAVTKTAKYVCFYEQMIIYGAIIGNILFIFDIHLPIFIPGLILYGLFSGMFIGLFAVCIAETIKALPIFIRRIRIGTGLGIIVLAIALGKAVGHLLYYFSLYR